MVKNELNGNVVLHNYEEKVLMKAEGVKEQALKRERFAKYNSCLSQISRTAYNSNYIESESDFSTLAQEDKDAIYSLLETNCKKEKNRYEWLTMSAGATSITSLSLWLAGIAVSDLAIFVAAFFASIGALASFAGMVGWSDENDVHNRVRIVKEFEKENQ